MTVDGGGVEKLLLFLEELFYFEQIFLEIAHRDLRRSVQKIYIYTYICDSLNDDMIYSLLFD